MPRMTAEQMQTDAEGMMTDSVGFTPWGAPIEIPDTRCKGDCGLINKRCADCKNFDIETTEGNGWAGCKLDYWHLGRQEGPREFRRKNKTAETCLEFRYVLTN